MTASPSYTETVRAYFRNAREVFIASPLVHVPTHRRAVAPVGPALDEEGVVIPSTYVGRHIAP